MPPRQVVALVRSRHSAAAAQTRALVEWAAGADAVLTRTVEVSADAIGEVCEDVRQWLCAGAVVERLDVLGGLVEQEAVRAVLVKAGGTLFVVDEHDRQELEQPTTDVRDLLRLYDDRVTTLSSRAGVARLQRGASAARAAGGRAGGRAPYGMRMVAGQLVEDAKEQAIVTRMEALWQRGMGYSEIGRQMGVEGYQKRDGSTTWHPDTVRRILLRRGVQPHEAQPVDNS
jgi:hypothetical protein